MIAEVVVTMVMVVVVGLWWLRRAKGRTEKTAVHRRNAMC